METTKTKAKKEPKTFTPSIDRGIPIPPKPKREPRSKSVGPRIYWPFAEMEIGDSVLVPDWAEPTRVVAYIDKAKRENKLPKTYKIEMRKTDDGVRVWRTN